MQPCPTNVIIIKHIIKKLQNKKVTKREMEQKNLFFRYESIMDFVMLGIFCVSPLFLSMNVSHTKCVISHVLVIKPCALKYPISRSFTYYCMLCKDCIVGHPTVQILARNSRIFMVISGRVDEI